MIYFWGQCNFLANISGIQLKAVLEQIDLIKKAILARAFRGELGTDDPSEGSAVNLVVQFVKDE